MPDLITLTPLGWAALGSTRLAETFPELARYDPEVQAILRPLFRAAVGNALANLQEKTAP